MLLLLIGKIAYKNENIHKFAEFNHFTGELGSELQQFDLPSLDSQELQVFADNFATTINNGSFPDLEIGGDGNEVKQESQQNNHAVVLYQPPIQYHQQAQPDHFGSHPTLVPVSTNYAFDMTVQQEQSVIFSQNKLFIKLGSKMTFSVSYREQMRNEPLFLRAMIVFSKPAEMHLAVKRCNNHRGTSTGPPTSALASIIRINNPKAMYCGVENGETFGDRLSVVMPLENGNFDED